MGPVHDLVADNFTIVGYMLDLPNTINGITWTCHTSGLTQAVNIDLLVGFRVSNRRLFNVAIKVRSKSYTLDDEQGIIFSS